MKPRRPQGRTSTAGKHQRSTTVSDASDAVYCGMTSTPLHYRRLQRPIFSSALSFQDLCCLDTSQRVQPLTGCTARDGSGAHPPLHDWAQFRLPVDAQLQPFFLSRRIRLTGPTGVRITPSVAQRSVWPRFFGRWRSLRHHTEFGGIFPHGTKQRTHSICYILPALCIPIICFNSPLVAFCWIVLWDVQAS